MDAGLPSVSFDDEAGLRRCLRDLVALAALPALWSSFDAQQIGESVAQALFGMLQLEFIHLSSPSYGIRVTQSHGSSASHDRIIRKLEPFLRAETAFQVSRIENPTGPGVLRLLLFPIGFVPSGYIALASSELGFPTEGQRLLVNVAANQMAAVLQRHEAHEALLRSEARLQQLTATLEERVAERSRQLEAEIADRQRAEEALRQAQKMESVGQLTGGVAHDINNLLMVIGGNLDLMARHSPSSADNRFFSSIARAVARGQNLTRQLLVFSRQQPLAPRVIDLAEEFPRLIDDLIRHSLRGDIEVETRIAPDCGLIMADATEFEVAILNVTVNARDAMPKGGRISISVANERDGELPGDAVSISIRDTGVGISSANLARVWEPFFTTKESGRGTGLGLSQVYGFAKQSGGTVRIASICGEGTTVTLLLPRWQGTRQPAMAAARPIARRMGSGSGRILLVEDNDEVAEVTRMQLADSGYEVLRACNAQEALDALSREQRLDLVLSDIIMPGGTNGLDLARKIRANHPSLPVLLMSGYSLSAQAALDEGYPIIPKPFQRETLQEQVARLLSL